jgi:hypothetical protein
MTFDGKLIDIMCQLIKAIWEDCFGIIICCLQYEALTICHAYGILMYTTILPATDIPCLRHFYKNTPVVCVYQ